jgi:hypothetical protein
MIYTTLQRKNGYSCNDTCSCFHLDFQHVCLFDFCVGFSVWDGFAKLGAEKVVSVTQEGLGFRLRTTRTVRKISRLRKLYCSWFVCMAYFQEMGRGNIF